MRTTCAHGGALSGGAGREVVLGGVACVNVWIVSVASGVVCASALVSGVRARVCVCVRQLQSAFTVCPSASVSVYSGTCVRLRVSLACQEPFNFREWRPSRFRLLSPARPAMWALGNVHGSERNEIKKGTHSARVLLRRLALKERIFLSSCASSVSNLRHCRDTFAHKGARAAAQQSPCAH